LGNEGIPQEVQEFVARHIGSVEQLELLLLLYRHNQREWSAEEAAKELYVDPSSAASRLAGFDRDGLVASRKDGEILRYRCSPRGDVDRIVRLVAQTYKERRVSMINLIFSNPLDHIRSFSDAFRLRRDED
jgi:hypothetical protein